MSFYERETIAQWNGVTLVRETYFPTWYGANRESMEYPLTDTADDDNYDNVTRTYLITYWGDSPTVITAILKHGEDWSENYEIKDTLTFMLSPTDRKAALASMNEIIGEAL